MSEVDEALIAAIKESENESEGEPVSKKADPVIDLYEEVTADKELETDKDEEKRDFDEILEHLNEEQQKIVMAPEKRIAVIAGPGSGKTTTLVARAILFAQNTNLEDMMLITFTRKAAQEMYRRINLYVDAKKMNIGTFHALSFKIIRDKLGRDAKYRIWDEDDRISVLKDITGETDAYKVYPIASLIAQYFMFPESQLTNEQKEMVNKYLPEYRKKIKEKMTEQNVIILDLAELVKIAINIIAKDQISKEALFVDESQDLNWIQFQFVKALNAEYLTMVGDVQQSIYAFRGATSTFFKQVIKDFPVYHLKKNYRSRPEIVKAAEALYKRDLIPEKEPGGVMHIERMADNIRENEFILEKVKDFQDSKDRTIAILARTRNEIREVSTFLTKNKIVHTVIGEYNLFKRKEIKDAIAYLDVIANPLAADSLLRIINEPPRGIGKKKKEDIKNLFEKEKKDVLKVLDEASMLWKGKAVENVHAFINIIEETRQEKGNVGKILFNVIKDTGYYERLTDSRKLHISSLIDFATSFDNIDEFILYTSMSKDSNIKNTPILVSTIHSVKGLEFDTVIIVNTVDGNIPMRNADMEQEKNLFYVAVTRAKDELYILVPKKIVLKTEEVNASTSPFVIEIFRKGGNGNGKNVVSNAETNTAKDKECSEIQ